MQENKLNQLSGLQQTIEDLNQNNAEKDAEVESLHDMAILQDAEISVLKRDNAGKDAQMSSEKILTARNILRKHNSMLTSGDEILIIAAMEEYAALPQYDYHDGGRNEHEMLLFLNEMISLK